MKTFQKLAWLLFMSMLLLPSGCDQSPKSPDYGSKLPGTFVETGDTGIFQRRLLAETEQGYLVQDFYAYYKTTSPFIIKRKEDLTKGIDSRDNFANVYDRIPSIDGPIELFWLDIFGQKQGERILTGQYRDGKREGRWQGFYRTGQQAFENNYTQGLLDGVTRRWYLTGELSSEAHYQQGIAQGTATAWYKNGQKAVEQHYKQGAQEGNYHYWYASGQPWIQGQYQQGQRQGTWHYWWTNGQPQKNITYQAGKILTEQPITPHNPTFQLGTAKYYICGAFNQQSIKLEGPYAISYSFIDDKFKKFSGIDNRQFGCEENPYAQMRRISVSFYWPEVNLIGDYKYALTDDRVMFDLEWPGGEQHFNLDFKDFELKTPEELQQKRIKDPTTGLWHMDEDNGNPVYWRYKTAPKLKRKIFCFASRDLEESVCWHSIYFPKYQASLTIQYLQTLLPQWRLIEAQAEQLIYDRTMKQPQ